MPDSPKRFGFAIAVSAIANLGLWFSLSQLASRVVPYRPPAVLEFSRVTMDEKRVIHEKIIQPKEVKKRIERVKPPEPKKELVPVPRQPAKPPPPQGAHNHVITVKSPNPAPDDHPFTAQAGGNAPVGVPTDQQNGNGTTNTDKPPPVAPPAAPPTEPIKQDPPAAPPIKPVEAPSQPAPPAAPPKPKSKGPSAEAQPTYQVNPQIPDDLKDQTFKSHVYAQVDVSADGSFEVKLLTTSGNANIDKVVLASLKKWKWKPKLVDGEPTESLKTFNFEFEVD